VHKRIWRVAEATVDDALRDLAPKEVAQLGRLLARVKLRVQGLAEPVVTAPPRRQAPAAASDVAAARKALRRKLRETLAVEVAS
jgi:hypothetical protein